MTTKRAAQILAAILARADAENGAHELLTVPVSLWPDDVEALRATVKIFDETTPSLVSSSGPHAIAIKADWERGALTKKKKP